MFNTKYWKNEVIPAYVKEITTQKNPRSLNVDIIALYCSINYNIKVSQCMDLINEEPINITFEQEETPNN